MEYRGVRPPPRVYLWPRVCLAKECRECRLPLYRRDVVDSLPRGIPMIVVYRWRCVRQWTRWWCKMNTGFIQVQAANRSVIPYVLRPYGLYWCVMRCFEGGPCLPYIAWGQGYKSKESNPSQLQLSYHGGHDIFPKWLDFLDRQVVSACSARFVEQLEHLRGLFWGAGPPHLV
jgi:hypothetical protein